ncbi:type II toxin-antitoxin system mRNA interferase toxin, RelE/StbE family [Bdellovibrio bacteriovorus]|uniref:Plasmid maintenance system killer protein n=1 Tax=Bdellovibrio bacteriovorus TaxID=959 RepID=A0A1Z3N936_BDEBC|nr:type II toxin-antitoxin system mRNA interferase toxin, RelE/StbE family [Bdellovibrio bacteriovorus]ASD63980.1 hypothetical protein B9G79_10565 [Bdellovibrio bacteriovorus]
MESRTQVRISRFAEKQLKRIPSHIKEALRYWAESIELIGLSQTRKLPGYHDEPLKGDRKGQRSIRLNRSYRAIYVETVKEIEIIVIEVNKHEF